MLSSFARGLLTVLALAGSAAAQCGFDEQRLIPADAYPWQQFGWAVAIDGDVMVVGAWQDGDRGVRSGAAYVFRRSGETWLEEQKLIASDAAPESYFGGAVAIDGDLLVIGAVYDDTIAQDAGAAYVFRFNGTQWQEEQKLVPATLQMYDNFGLDVAVDGDLIVIGQTDDFQVRTGSAFVYRFSGAVWTEETQLSAGDGHNGNGFGVSVDIDGERVVVGAFAQRHQGQETGASYVFKHTAGVWSEEQKLVAANRKAQDLFGRSVAIDGKRIVVGAPWSDSGGSSNIGSLFVFDFDGLKWNDTVRLLPSKRQAYQYFGQSIDVEGSVVVAGSLWDDEAGVGTGSAYVFRQVQGVWNEIARIVSEDARASSMFGESVSLSDGLLLGGASLRNARGRNSGAVYLFRVRDPVLHFEADNTSTGGSLTVDVCNGAAGSPMLLYAIQVDGTPVWVRVATDVLDAQGSWSFQGSVPPGLAGVVVDFQGFTLDLDSRAAFTNVETVEFGPTHR